MTVVVAGILIVVAGAGFAAVHRQHSNRFDAAMAFYTWDVLMGLAYVANSRSSSAASILIAAAFAVLAVKGSYVLYSRLARNRIDA